MTPLILLALLGFGVALTVDSTSDEDDDQIQEAEPDSEDVVQSVQIPPAGPLPIVPLQPEVPDTMGQTGFIETTEDFTFIQAPVGGTVEGQPGENLIAGTDGNDTLYGFSDNDTIIAGAGDDFALGGQGDDLIFLGEGDDQMYGFIGSQLGDDTISGGSGNDAILDSFGSNQIFGGDGDDQIYGQGSIDDGTPPETTSTPDFIDGGAGADVIFSHDGDTVVGGAGNDLINVIRNDALPFDVAPTIIEDFDVNEDVLSIELSDEDIDPTQAELEFVENAEAGGLTVIAFSNPVAFLRGLDASDIPNIHSVRVSYDSPPVNL